MPKKSKLQISHLISKNIQKNNCLVHNQPINRLSLQNLKLGCVSCKFERKIKIQQAIRNPIQVAIGHIQCKTKQSGKIIQDLKNIEDFKKIKSGFELAVEQIRKQLNKKCDALVQTYKQQWDKAFEASISKVEQIKQAQTRYRVVFQQLLESTYKSGTLQQIEQIMSIFCNQFSEDPTDYLKLRIGVIQKCEQLMPVVGWQKLRNIYSIANDEDLWTVDKIVKHCVKEEVQNRSKLKQVNQERNNGLIPQMNNQLKNNKFMIKFNTQGITLMENLELGSTKQIFNYKCAIDNLYEVDQYRLIATNYQTVTVLSYALGQISKLSSFPIKGCSNLIVNADCCVLQSEGRIVRLWLNDGYKEIVCLSGSNLMPAPDQHQFRFTDSRGKIVTSPFFHDHF